MNEVRLSSRVLGQLLEYFRTKGYSYSRDIMRKRETGNVQLKIFSCCCCRFCTGGDKLTTSESFVAK